MQRLAILGVLMLVGCAPSPTPATTRMIDPAALDFAAVARGRTLVEARCSSCHAIGPVGDSPVPPAPPLRTLGQRYPVSDLEEAFAEGITNGHPIMPEFVLEPNEIADLVAYLKSIQSAEVEN